MKSENFHIIASVAIAVMLCTACNNVPVIENDVPAGDLTENLINANRYIAQSEEAQIEAYAQRRGWQMATLPCGARVMMTDDGNGQTIYSHVTDTVVAGRLQPTRGLDAALLTMQHGGRARVILPSEQAYGVVGDGDRIGTRTVLVYDVRVR